MANRLPLTLGNDDLIECDDVILYPAPSHRNYSQPEVASTRIITPAPSKGKVAQFWIHEPDKASPIN
jgi:hypothetical protein